MTQNYTEKFINITIPVGQSSSRNYWFTCGILWKYKFTVFCGLVTIFFFLISWGQQHSSFESHYKTDHLHIDTGTASVLPRSPGLFPLDRPLITLKDLLSQKPLSPHCKQYFSEVVLPRSVEENVFKASSTDQVCLVTHFTPSRINMFQYLLKYWNGTMSVALYADNRDYLAIKSDLEVLLHSDNRSNVFIHIVIKDGEYYPINYLRNVAMRSVGGCAYQFLTDIDFMPSLDLHSVLASYLLQGIFNTTTNLALVVPAFSLPGETSNKTDVSEHVPRNKDQLLKMWNEQKLHQFHPDGNGHKGTNYLKWRTADKPYQSQYREGYEPYILIPQARAPYFVNLFLQRYGNKVSYFVELKARGFDFLVIPDGFVVHLPHPSQDNKKLFDRIGRCTSRIFNTLKSKLKEMRKIEPNRTAT